MNSENNKFNNLGKNFFPESPRIKIRLTKDNNNNEIQNLFKIINDLRDLKYKTKLNKKILSEENILKEIKKETSPSSPKNNVKKPRKKMILLPYEMFNYDPKKWKNNYCCNEVKKDKNMNMNEINKKIDGTISEMKKKVIFLNQEIFKLEEIRNKMKSQKKLMAVKSKTLKNIKSHFFTHDEKKKYLRKQTRFNIV